MHLDSQVLSAIHQAISFEVFKEILTCKSAHEAWTKLEDIYGGSNLDEDYSFQGVNGGVIHTFES